MTRKGILLMRWRRRWEEDWFDWEEDGPKLIKRIVLGVISAALAVAGCFVFVSSNVGMFGGGIHEGFVSDSFEEDSDIVYVRDFTFEKIEGQNAYCVTGLSAEGKTKSDVIIPNTYNGLPVVEIKGGNYNEGAFYNCVNLTSVVIGGSVTEIGENAFRNCSSLTSVEIGDSVTSIGYDAFCDCDALTSVVIGDSVTTIGSWAFEDCDGLTSVEIGDSVTSIGDAFRDCDSLTSITLDKDNTVYQSIDGNLYSKDGKTLIQYAIGKTATEFVIPEGVTTIGAYAFWNCSSLTSVVIPDSVTSIGSWAFSYCDSLTSVVIGDSVTTIGNSAFSWCNSLTSVVIGDSVTTIGSLAFNSCNSLTSVYYKGTASDWENISVDDYYNDSLTAAARYYYDESERVEMWWHYDIVHA